VRNEVLRTVEEERDVVLTIKRTKANWSGQILRSNRLLKHVIQGKIVGRTEVTEKRGRIRKQLLGDLKETGGYWKLK
jgi:hypothetical protein